MEIISKINFSSIFIFNKRNYLQVGISWGIAIFIIKLTIINITSLIVPATLLGKPAAASYFDTDPSIISIIFFVLIFAPLYETFLVQLIPIEIMRKLKFHYFLIIFFCATLFGIGHYLNGGLSHGIGTFFSGGMYSYLYLNTRVHGPKNSYFITAMAHCANNFIAISAMKYIGVN